MTLTEGILEELGKIASGSEMKSEGKYFTGSLIFKAVGLEDIVEKTLRLIDKLVENGEIITCRIEGGGVVDMGQKTLEIAKGSLIELYDYGAMSVTFLRFYQFQQGNKVWLALYIDENLGTPWWSKSERGEES